MTFEEKAQALYKYCDEHECSENCVLYGKIPLTEPCVVGKNLLRNYEIIFGSKSEEAPEENKDKGSEKPIKKTCSNCWNADQDSYTKPCSECQFRNVFEVIPTKWESAENPYWKRIEALAEQQRAKGISKYGQGLEMNPMKIIERLTYLEEELMDGLFYIEHIKAYIVDKEQST